MSNVDYASLQIKDIYQNGDQKQCHIKHDMAIQPDGQLLCLQKIQAKVTL